ncbi:MAG: lysine--tRNA ligase [Candidatus Latescibacterota bacterium]|nr:MAG: lysine--tRNA ligase [Candidatus Latescibacterota bacterium]
MHTEGSDELRVEGIEKIKAVRIEKLEGLRSAGINPYPYRFEVSHKIDELITTEAALTEAKTMLSIAGRIMALRGHGATTFGHLEDRTGRLQFYVRRDAVGDAAYRHFKLIEVGDIIGIRGTLFRTKTNELTLRVDDYSVLTKALRPLPEKWHGLQDKELRYRQRYVDLIVNPSARDVFYTRFRLMDLMRQFLLDRGYLEVETPILQPIYGGASARPFVTHHNALDIDLYLRIADELYLKRLLVGGLEKVFEFCKDFRNEGIDRAHNPEFTMMECYSAYEDYTDYMDMVEEMLRTIAGELTENGKVTFRGDEIDFNTPWTRIRFFDALEQVIGLDFRQMGMEEMLDVASRYQIDLDKITSPAKGLDLIFSEAVEPTLVQPTFVYDYPKALSPLAKDHRSEPGLVERFEPFIGGFEVGNAFSELNDPQEQRARFEEQAAMRSLGDEEAHMIDEDYLRALEYGMPPSAGLGLGVDRLVMIFTDSNSIRDVLFFPQMRPESR